MQAIFSPIRIMGQLQELFVVNAAAGEEMSMFVGHGKKAGLLYEQVYACGNNLRGQLGIARPSHLMDLTLVSDISDLFDEKDEALMLSDLVCGRRHCIAHYDYGAFKFWGDNNSGQLGNRKRAYVDSPHPSNKFTKRHNVEHVVAGLDSSAAIVEDPGPRKKRKKNFEKRKLTMDQVVRSEAELKRRAEELVVKPLDPQDPSKLSAPARVRAWLFGNGEVRDEIKR